MTEFNGVHFIKHGSVETVIVAHLVQIFLATYGHKLFIPAFTIPAALMLSSVTLLESALLPPVLLTPTLCSFLCPDLSRDPPMRATCPIDLFAFLKECHPRCVYQNYSRSKIREVAVKKHNYICRYNNLPTYMFRPL